MPATTHLSRPAPGRQVNTALSDHLSSGKAAKTILYVGENPAAGTGSPIIVLRHLQRFAADGWKVVVVGDYGGDYRDCKAAGWTVIPLCHRRWWWPPYRDHSMVLRRTRLALLARDVAERAGRIDVVFSYLAAHADFSAELATHIARRTRVELHMLAHDDAASFPYAKGREQEFRQAHDRILKAADVSWFVSPELADCYPSAKKKHRLLYPIPEGWESPAVWRDELSHHSAIYYAGRLWPEQLPLMGRIARSASAAGAELVIMARQTDVLREFCLTEPARWHAQFPTNREALAHLVNEAAGVLVPYADTLADMPWCATSFPSKLVEYCHLGLPVAVVAPLDSSVALWAKRVQFPYFFNPAEPVRLQEWFAGLKQREVWERCAATSLRFARTEFDPARIQEELANSMIAGTDRRAR